MNRQEEADEVIREFLGRIENRFDKKACAYADKYLKPKGPMFEEFEKYYKNICEPEFVSIEDEFKRFKKALEKYFYSNYRLDQAIEVVGDLLFVGDMESTKEALTQTLKQIKDRLERRTKGSFSRKK